MHISEHNQNKMPNNTYRFRLFITPRTLKTVDVKTPKLHSNQVPIANFR